MAPAAEAIVPALECTSCGRLIPITGARSPKVGNRELKRAMRGARRLKMRREAAQ